MSEAIEAEVMEAGTDVAVISPQRSADIVRAAGDVGEAFAEYQSIQAQLDKAMPDCIMNIQGRKFRKKNYWRAIATAFNLTVEPFSEERQEFDGDWGYVVSYRAIAPNGRSATGDGACFGSEKVVTDNSGNVIAWKTEKNQTVHNVRSHAHTRGFNRAVSNLVGFGEVSADEMDTRGGGEVQGGAIAGGEPPRSADRASDKQVKMIWAKTSAAAEAIMEAAQDADESVPFAHAKALSRALVDKVFEVVGVDEVDGKPAILKREVDAIVKGIEAATLDADGAVSVPGAGEGPF